MPSHHNLQGFEQFNVDQFNKNGLLNNPGMHWLKACQMLEQQGEAYCIATVVAYVGSVPRSSGAKMVITPACQFDTLGGGNLEFQVIAQAREGLASHQSQVAIERFSLSADLGQCCGGAVQVMFEYFHTQTPQVVIFGAGHVCQALTTVLNELPCQLTVVDSRHEWLAPLQDKGIKVELLENPIEALGQLPSNAYVIVMTQDHGLDFEITRLALEENRFAFVGLIGSQGKKQRFEFRLKEQLTDADLIHNLTCPIGHPDVKGKLPMQVAVSVAAQLIGLFSEQEANTINRESNSEEVQWKQANEARKVLKEEKQ